MGSRTRGAAQTADTAIKAPLDVRAVAASTVKLFDAPAPRARAAAAPKVLVDRELIKEEKARERGKLDMSYWNQQRSQPAVMPQQAVHGQAGELVLLQQQQLDPNMEGFVPQYEDDGNYDDAADAEELAYHPPHYTVAQRIEDEHARHNEEIERRIQRVDNNVLDDARFAHRLSDVMRHARALIAAVGVDYVRVLYVHAHARVVTSRDGRQVLTGVVLIVAGNAPAWRIPGNWGAACMIAAVKPPTAGVTLTHGINEFKRSAYESPDASVADTARFVDEAITDVAAETIATQGQPVATLAYDGTVMVCEGFGSNGVRHYIMSCNHSPQAVKCAKQVLAHEHLTVSEFYRSRAYRMCVTHGAMQCSLMAAALADAMHMPPHHSADVPYQHAHGYDVHVKVATPERYAPHTYITPVLVSDPTGQDDLVYQVHLGTYGDYSNATMPLERPVTRPGERSTRFNFVKDAPVRPAPSAPSAVVVGSLLVDTPTSTEHHGYVVRNSSTSGFLVLTHRVQDELHEQYWLEARGEDAAQARAETRAMLPSLSRSMAYGGIHIGYPISGLYDGHVDDRRMDAFELPAEQQRRVLYSGHVQPYQVSGRYLDLVENNEHSTLGQRLLQLQHTLFPTDTRKLSFFTVSTRGTMSAMYVGGLNTHHGVTVAHAVLTISPKDFIRVPLTNERMHAEILELLRLYQHEVQQHGSRSATELTQEISGRSTLLAKARGASDSDYLFVMSGGAVQYSPDRVLLVDRKWLAHVVLRRSPHVLPQV